MIPTAARDEPVGSILREVEDGMTYQTMMASHRGLAGAEIYGAI